MSGVAPKRPGQLLAITVIAFLLGSTGVCMGCFGVTSPLTQQLQLDQFERMGAYDPEMQRQADLQREIQSALAPYMPISIAHQAFNLIVSFLLVLAGVLLLRWHTRAPPAFTIAALAGLVIDLFGAVYGIVVQRATAEAMEGAMRSIAETQPGAPPGMGEVMGATAQASATMSICMGVMLFAAKAAFYVWGIVYLRGDEAKALFAPKAQAAAPAAPPAQPPQP